MTNNVRLRDVIVNDLPVFYEHQLDPVAARMADFPVRERDPYMAHWAEILDDVSIFKQSILFNEELAGNIVSCVQSGDREVGYWIGREYWGKGIATSALSAFLSQVDARPLFAHVARHNIASRRVLEKCGFTILHEESNVVLGQPAEEYILILNVIEGS